MRDARDTRESICLNAPVFSLSHCQTLFFFEYFRHRHVPKAVFKAAKEKKIMLASIKQKYVLSINLFNVNNVE